MRIGTSRIRDEPAEVSVEPPIILHRGFRTYAEFGIALTLADARQTSQRRELVLAGHVVVVLPYDPVRDEIVLIRQFRLGAHLATSCGKMIEVVAGRVEHGEALDEAARRETLEETGLVAGELVPGPAFLSSPGLTDEQIFLFCARVDVSGLAFHSGAADEDEFTEPFRMQAVAIVDALEEGPEFRNGHALLALYWFALNRVRLRRLWS